MDDRVEQAEFRPHDGDAPIGAAASIARLGLRSIQPPGRGDPTMDALLDRQTRLIELQAEHLNEQHELELKRLRTHRWRDRMALALQALGLVVGAAIVGAAAVLVWSAHQDRGLVIAPFSVPPNLAARGLNGQVVASQLLDKLTAMQARTDSSRPAGSYRNNWGGDLEVDTPETALSFGDLDHWLHQRLSQQMHITGEVVETSQGLALTARTEAGGDSFAGGSGELDNLLQQSAEAIYRRSQPYRYAIWQIASGRMDQGMDLLVRLGDGPAGPDRVWANSVLGTLLVARGDSAGGLARNLDAVKTSPEDPHAWGALSNALSSLGHDEGALAALRKGDMLLRRHPDAEAPGPRSMLLTTNVANLAEALGDFRTGADWETRAGALPESFGSAGAPRAQVVADLAGAHDAAGSDTARAEAQSMKVPDISLLPALLDADLALGRFNTAAREGEALQALVAQPASLQAWLQRPWAVRVELAKLAFAKAMAGDGEDARDLVASTPLDCYDCLRMRGKIAAAGGDWLDAERWFGQATKSAPSLPFAWTDWGQMRLAMGDASGAIAVLQTAHQKGPRFADPLELMGEALTARRDYEGAAARFAEADRYAPGWGRNHLEWGKALMLLGRSADARAQFDAAAGLDLSRADRAALDTLLVRTAGGGPNG